MLDAGSAVPLYAQVEAALAAEIGEGRLAPGSQLAPEGSLSERFGVSRPTVRQAIQRLIRRGLVEIRRGKGTFVAPPKLTQPLTALTGFVEDMIAAGRAPTAQLVDKKLMAATALVARQLGVPEGEAVVRIRRVRLADGAPVSFDETYLPRALGVKIMQDDLEAEPIFALLEDKYGIALVEAEYRLEAVAAKGVIARALGMRPGSPILLVERTSLAAKQRAVDYEKLYYRGDQVRFVTRLPRRPTGSVQPKAAVGVKVAAR
jgi:GntR family transcriptional regulator